MSARLSYTRLSQPGCFSCAVGACASFNSLSCCEISRRLALICLSVARRDARLSSTDDRTARHVTPTDIVTPSVTI